MSKELQKFVRSTSVNSAGELTVNAGRYSRAAMIMTFEMLGGVERLVEEADNDYWEFMKYFGKTIGREVEVTQADDVEDLLDVLDGEATEITDVEIIPDDEREILNDPTPPSRHDIRMAKAAAEYADAHPLD